ncbi:MAG: hypothetical protein PSW75_00955 [bacterium]|nr:hypothetical protein [bacterium]MDI1337364.1 hypothetical protein [Lacunisphaera sp.]
MTWRDLPSEVEWEYVCRAASRVEVTPEARPTDAMGYRLMLRPLED